LKAKIMEAKLKTEAATIRHDALLDPFRVKPFKDQPRKRFRGIPQLAESIRLVGQVTPIIVTACEANGFDAELVDGERRLQACRLGKLRIRAVFRDGVPDADRFALAIAANFCRQEHDCVEIAEAVERLKVNGRSDLEVGGIFGKSGCWVQQHRALLKLHPDVLEMLKRGGDEDNKRRRCGRGGRLTFSIALLLVALKPAVQLKLAKRIVTQKLPLAQARSLVYRTARDAGKKVGTDKPGRGNSPKTRLQQLWNIIDTARHRIEPIMDMKFAELSAIFALASERERQTLLAQLDDLRHGLDGIAKTLRKVEGTRT
jgi:ParB/RepB/Spo0J family partition protein